MKQSTTTNSAVLTSTVKPTKLRLEHLQSLEPITENQTKVFEAYKKDYNLVLSGSAGSGKTFLSMYLGLKDVLDKNTQYDKVVIVRSVVPTRDIGFLPGTEEEKKASYTLPYVSIASELFGEKNAYEKLVAQGAMEFMTTSFIRGTTIKNAVIVVDEFQNCSGHELDSVITRVGENCKIIFSGDYYQSDFTKANDKNGCLKFLEIVNEMRGFKHIEFTWKDIVRSDMVRDYIMTKEMKKITF